MTLRQVSYFLAVTEAGSFTVAARKLRIAQPSLSQQVQALERDVGAELLERTSRGARLTPEGREFIPEARAMLAAAQRARLAVRQTAALEAGELQVATVRSLAVGVLPALIGEFRRRHPGVRIWLREFAHRNDLNDAVMAGMSAGVAARMETVDMAPALFHQTAKRKRPGGSGRGVFRFRMVWLSGGRRPAAAASGTG